ncbi:hypothetical protein FHT78_001238 [Rhizobium sp. BK196]|jgi:hypothetical protein|nr:hypothetical protein [Rhizobium sp. BK196]MBB3465159.1 hypothetical protein [Rhizobium sp. BK377]
MEVIIYKARVDVAIDLDRSKAQSIKAAPMQRSKSVRPRYGDTVF